MAVVSEKTVVISGHTYKQTIYDDGSETLELINVVKPVLPKLQITLSATQVAVNTPVTATVTVQNPDGTAVAVNNTYHCPVIRRGDNAQKAFLTITLTNGAGAVSFSLPESGIYTIDPDLIRPMPAAELPEALELLVTP